MGNRKLYTPVRIPSYEEFAAHIEILRSIGSCNTPVAESCYAWKGIGDGRRNTEKQASVYDAMMAELHGDKARRAEKFRKTHDRCKKSKDKTPADRRRDKINRVRKMYGLAFEDGHNWYWEYGSTGSKQTTEPDAETFRNLKYAEMEKAAYAELLPDPEHYVGKTTLTGMMHHLWQIMVAMQEPYEQRGCDCFGRYYYEYDGDIHHKCYYKPEYYDVLYDYEVLRRWSNVLAAQKRGVTIPDMTPEEVDYFCDNGKSTFDRLVAEFSPQPRYIDEGWKDWRDYSDRLDEEYWKSLGELDDFLWDESISQMGQEDGWYD